MPIRRVVVALSAVVVTVTGPAVTGLAVTGPAATGPAVTGLAATAATAAPAAAASPGRSHERPTYVALGDSYAAGYGLPAPAQGTRPGHPGCAQTSRDYPRRLARWLRLALTDASCTGATTADFFARQDTPGPNPPAQLDVVRRRQPDLVTVTIGGNDLGFIAITRTCLALTPLGPLLLHPTYRSCRDYYRSGTGAAADPLSLLAAVRAKIRAALAAVHRAAPRARIVVIGYPAIAPDARHTPAGGCYAANAIRPTLVGGIPLTSAFPFTNRDVPFLATVQRRLDRGIRHAARRVGARYVDIYHTSLAHSACAPESTRWVEPLIPGGGGTNVLHPSLKGTGAMAAALKPTVRRLLRSHD